MAGEKRRRRCCARASNLSAWILSMPKRRVAHVINGMGLGGVTPVVYHLLRNLPAERYALHLYALTRHPDHSQAVRAAQVEQVRGLGLPLCFARRGRHRL